MRLLPPSSTRTDTLSPYTPLFRSPLLLSATSVPRDPSRMIRVGATSRSPAASTGDAAAPSAAAVNRPKAFKKRSMDTIPTIVREPATHRPDGRVLITPPWLILDRKSKHLNSRH